MIRAPIRQMKVQSIDCRVHVLFQRFIIRYIHEDRKATLTDEITYKDAKHCEICVPAKSNASKILRHGTRFMYRDASSLT